MDYRSITGKVGVIWLDPESGCSGVIQPGDEGWDDYKAWIAAGNAPASIYPPLTFEQALQEIVQEFERVLEPIKSGYSDSEVASWPMQCAEATAWLANEQSPTPMIDGLLLPWEDKREMCTAILSSATAHSTAMGELIMWRRIATAAIEAYFDSGRPITSLIVQYPEVPYAS